MPIRATLARVLNAPAAADVWQLRADLLEAELSAESRAWRVVEELHRFLDQLATSASSRDYSHLASKMDIGAIGGVLLAQVVECEDAEDLALRLFTGVVSEGLMVLATRQHVKAWEGELDAVYRGASWFLYGEVWHWSRQLKAEIPAGERRQLIDRLLAPIRDPSTSGFLKAVVIGRLFQVLLLSYLAADLT